eukprot:TRINITY_DN67995_c0_g1_i1.p2 TRINITY_DN67995_c0_g1~~TRINITY_DN67995_c0_g1_i1.p2  ORF type:complete len:185 (+),score=98.63 TRINITY_DN67995_c0_g1_i1:57-611(+)
MAHTGTVISWSRAFGFASMEDGTAVYIHTDDIEGGRLRVGLSVKFDTTDGKDGKIRGTNISGEAVLAKGTELSDEEKAADRERMKEIREKNKDRNAKELEEILAKVNALSGRNQRAIMTKLAEEFSLGKEERRQDHTDSKNRAFTKGEFIAFYGQKDGEKRWSAAGKKGESKPAAPKERKLTKE